MWCGHGLIAIGFLNMGAVLAGKLAIGIASALRRVYRLNAEQAYRWKGRATARAWLRVTES